MFSLSLLFLSCTTVDKTEKASQNATPPTAKRPKQDTIDAETNAKNKLGSFAPPATCAAEKLSQECSSWLVETLQAFAAPPYPKNQGRNHPLQKYNTRAEPLSLQQYGPEIHVFKGDLDTAPKMIAALQDLVSQSKVQEVLDSHLREYKGKVVTAYSDCDESAVVPRDGKWYFAPQGDDTGLDLTHSVPFVKNNKGNWVLDLDISFGCWQVPFISDPKQAEQFQKITFVP